MASALYDFGRQKFLDGLVAWTTDTIKAALVNTSTYTVNLATHQWLSDITSGAIIATSAALTTKSSTAGVAAADNVTFTAVTGSAAGALILYKDTGTAGTSALIAYIDQATGLPVTPSGGDIIVQWSTGSSHIFKL